MRLSKGVKLQTTDGQVDTLVVENDLAMARISLFGGHVLSYIPHSDARDRLWMSGNAILDGSKAIRGGIPICWPWFGDHPSGNFPAHGYVRTQQWQVVGCEDQSIGTIVKLKPESALGAGLDGELDLLLTITVGEVLTLELTTTNIGANALAFGAALHSYFDIEDIGLTELRGLNGEFLDKTESYASKVTPEVYLFQKETDNVHLSPVTHTVIHTPKFDVDVESMGHDSIVVWNPWIEKSTAMADMKDDSYRSMLCVEAAITQGKTLAAGEQHSLIQTIQ